MENFEQYMLKFFQHKTGIFKSYLTAALDNQEQHLSYLKDSLGTTSSSIDIRNCEILTEALLFREEVKLTRDGRNRYKLFYLTDLGREMALQLKEESYTDELSESPKISEK
ncbi:MAG: hypothetical protein NWF01_07570 [Candidatus Bathyarchaeota archaeon]|nr:hypothetical protein [Candidatus Bathyarchaeota archaeon]